VESGKEGCRGYHCCSSGEWERGLQRLSLLLPQYLVMRVAFFVTVHRSGDADMVLVGAYLLDGGRLYVFKPF
jgi:hypothetical protein